MKNIARLGLVLICAALLVDCKKPSYNAGLNVNGEVLQHGITFQFCDAGDTTFLPEKELFVKITGPDASKIYEFGGTRIFNVRRGILNVGLHPNFIPTAASPVKFTLEVFSPDYLPLKVPVTIDGSIKQQRVLVTMIDLKKPPKGITVSKNSLTVNANGSLANTEILASPITASTPENVTLRIPQGTLFFNASGNVIQPNGTLLEMTTVFFSSRSAHAMTAFPNGNVMADSIMTPGGKIAGFHQSAGMVYVSMSMAGQEVRSLSNPIEYEVTMDPAFISGATNIPIDANEVVPIWNFNYTKNRWDRQGQDTLEYQSGTLVSTFRAANLGFNSIGWVKNRCMQNTTLTFNNGLPLMHTSYLVDIFSATGDPRHPLVAGLFVEVMGGQAITNVPMPEGPVVIKVYENRLKNDQYNYFNRQYAPVATYTGNPCGNNINLNITAPADMQRHFFNVLGYCTSGSFYVFPTIPTFYKDEKSKMNYSMLGTVHLGKFSTTNIKVNGHYHFIWIAGANFFTKEKLIDSLSYARDITVPAVIPGDTLRELWCY